MKLEVENALSRSASGARFLVGKRLKPNQTGLVGKERWWAQQPDKFNIAVTWLRAALAGGMVSSLDILAKSRDNGITYKTLRRAQCALGVKPERIPRGRLGKWFWVLPRGD